MEICPPEKLTNVSHFISRGLFCNYQKDVAARRASITEMAVVGVTTAIRHLLAEAGGGGKYGLPPRARLQRDDYFFT